MNIFFLYLVTCDGAGVPSIPSIAPAVLCSFKENIQVLIFWKGFLAGIFPAMLCSFKENIQVLIFWKGLLAGIFHLSAQSSKIQP